MQLISTVVLLATTASFYLDQDWTASLDRAAALVHALKIDFGFNVNYTFGWPKLPHLGEIYFLFSFSVLTSQLVIKYFIRFYYGTRASIFGKSTLLAALEELKKRSDPRDVRGFDIISATLLLQNVLSCALYVAIKMDMFVLKVTADRKFNEDKKYIEKQREKAQKRSSTQLNSTKSPRIEAKKVHQKFGN